MKFKLKPLDEKSAAAATDSLRTSSLSQKSNLPKINDKLNSKKTSSIDPNDKIALERRAFVTNIMTDLNKKVDAMYAMTQPVHKDEEANGSQLRNGQNSIDRDSQ